MATKKKVQQDSSTVVTAIAIAFFCLVVGFVIGWLYLKPASPYDLHNVTFAQLEPVQIRGQGFAFVADVAVQASADDATWLKENRKTLNDVMNQVLLATQPDDLRRPGGLAEVQATLAGKVNRMVGSNRVQEVFFTGFVSQGIGG